ncbi:DUF6498-containing protein [Halopenitus salinus]|uniref:DUF6498-containing protein n=1 Tax=Halopenitus salinus TaxID=1198295 RepID=A0ABD5V3N2_9EURY
MISRNTLQDHSPPSETSAVVIANVLPLVGVVAFDWNLAALVFLYWLELGIISFWALLKAVFAGRPSEFDSNPLIGGALARKRTAIPVPFTGLGIQLSTLPVLVVAVPVLSLVWFFVGVTTIGVIGAKIPEQSALELVVLSSFGIFLSQGASTLVEYFYQGDYRDHSAQTAIQGIFMRGAVIGVGGLLTATFVGLAADSVSGDDPITAVDPTIVGPPILVGIVLVKFSFDLGGLYRDRLAAFDESSSFELGWAYEPPTHEPIESVNTVNERIRPSVFGRLFGGLTPANVRRHPGVLFVGGFILLISLLFAMGRVWDIVLSLVGVSLVVPIGLLMVDYGLRYGGVVFRVSDEAIVAYDSLFRTRLWRIEPWDERGLRVERDRLHEWIGTSTIVIESADRELRVPHVYDPAPIIDMFDRQPTGLTTRTSK